MAPGHNSLVRDGIEFKVRDWVAFTIFAPSRFAFALDEPDCADCFMASDENALGAFQPHRNAINAEVRLAILWQIAGRNPDFMIAPPLKSILSLCQLLRFALLPGLLLLSIAEKFFSGEAFERGAVRQVNWKAEKLRQPFSCLKVGESL